jgi:hypothetical protein
MAIPDRHTKGATAQTSVLAAMSRIRRVAARPGGRYPVICVGADDRLVPAPMEWYRLRAERNEPRSTIDTYLGHILAVLTHFEEQGVRWNDEPKVVRTTFVHFLRHKLRLVVQRDELDGWRYQPTTKTPLAPSTINVTRAALKNFYGVMAEEEVGYYPFANPLESQVLKELNGVRDAAQARGELPTGTTRGAWSAAPWRQPSAFVRAKKQHEWQPDARLSARDVLAGIFAVVEAIVADPDLAERDKAILLLLRYTGPRAFEPATMTVGGYRGRGRTGLLKVTSKGAQGRLVKTLAFEGQPRIQGHLDRYLRDERPRWDRDNRSRLADVRDDEPFFLTRRGDAYNYDALAYHWGGHYARHRHLCPLPISLHDIRHAYVTEHLLRLREEQELNGHDDAWRLEQRRTFGADIMGWHGEETIAIYDHAIDELEGWGRVAAQQRGDAIVRDPRRALPPTPPGAAGAATPAGTEPPDPAPRKGGYSAEFLARIERHGTEQGRKGEQ